MFEIKDGDVVILDVETTGLDWKKDLPCGYVITVEDSNGQPISNYYPVRHETGPNMDLLGVISWIKSWANKKIHIVGHNIKFDLHFCANDGIYFPNATFEDTSINGCLIDEHSTSFSLDAMATKFQAPAKKGDELYRHMATLFGGTPTRAQMGNYWRLPADDFLAVDYAIGDGDSTFYLWKNQQRWLDFMGLREVWKLECRCIPVLFRMERRGVAVDEGQLAHLSKWLDKKLEESLKLLPRSDFNVRSPKDLEKAFVDRGITDFPRTPKGNPSFVEEWLLKSTLGRAIVDVRKLTNLRNTFIQGAILANLHKGRIHTNFNQLRGDEYGTITGRLSSSNPNMQQVPKRDKLLAPIFRSVYIPDSGCFWSANDYSQQEYRVFAAYTNSEAIIRGYQEGMDVHSVVAGMTGLDRDTKAKRINMGMLNWMGKKKLALEMGVTEPEALPILTLYHEKFPETMGFLKACQERVRAVGYVKTIKGRRANFPDREFAYRGASRVIQGTCADLTKEKMCEVDEYLSSESRGSLGVQLQVHDSLEFSVPHDAEHLNKGSLDIMQDFSAYPRLRVPMKVDHGRGKSWGHASFPKADWTKYEVEDG